MDAFEDFSDLGCCRHMTRFPQGEANCWINEKLLFANMQAGTFLKGPAPAERGNTLH